MIISYYYCYWVDADEEYLFFYVYHRSNHAWILLSNLFLWPAEVSLHQVVELVVVGGEELSEPGYESVRDSGMLPALALVEAVLLGPPPRAVAMEALCGVEVKLQHGR